MNGIFPEFDWDDPSWSGTFSNRASRRLLLYYLRDRMEVLTLDVDKCSLILMFLEIRAQYSANQAVDSIIYAYPVRGMTADKAKDLAAWIRSWVHKLRLHKALRPLVMERLEFNYFMALLYRVEVPIYFSDRDVAFAILMTAFSDGMIGSHCNMMELREACEVFRNGIKTQRQVTFEDWSGLLLAFAAK